MKRLIVGLLALVPLLSQGAALDLFMNQRDATNTNTLTRQIAHPPGTADGIFGYVGATQLPGFLSVGPGLTLTGGVLDTVPGGGVTWASVTGKPDFATVATTGAYADLSGKPVLFNGAYGSLTGIPATFTPSAHTQPWSTITATPTTLAGYGITDAATAAALAGKFNTPTGTPAQYVRGDGSLSALVINDTPGRALVTSTAATGYQVSATRAAQVCYEGVFATTSTIGGPSSASVFLETADANSTTPSDWAVRAQQTYSNTITLAVVLNQVQSNNWSVCRIIPAGKFVRLRSGNITGTASVTLNATQQETLY